jgi:hypothetical protein
MVKMVFLQSLTLFILLVVDTEVEVMVEMVALVVEVVFLEEPMQVVLVHQIKVLLVVVMVVVHLIQLVVEVVQELLVRMVLVATLVLVAQVLLLQSQVLV